jgi:predicted phosphate transport protein (TIGR00153 family)
MMALRLLPREESFFDMFNEAAENMLQAARLLKAMMDDYRDVERQAAAIKAIEDRGDEMTHLIIERLNRTFVVPIDREDIFALAKQLDDVLDWIEAAAARMAVYQIPHSTPEAQELAHIIVNECQAVVEAVKNLRSLDKLEGPVKEINRLENLADHLQRDAIARLFATVSNPIDVIKWKEIYETLEEATDQGEHVAHLLEGIHAKNM